MKPSGPPCDHETLLALLHYNKLTGLLTWRINRSRLAKAGDEAGTFAHDGTVVVGIQGRMCAASKLVWFYVNAAWPTSRLRFRDSDPANLRWNNIYEENAKLSQKHINVYQRKRRRIMKLANIKLQTDPSLQQAYLTAPNPAAARDLMRTIAAQVEEELLRNHIDPASRPAPRDARSIRRTRPLRYRKGHQTT